MRTRTALALGLAGLATAGLGAALPAGAQLRTFTLTLADGSKVDVSVDVAADADPWKIDYPDIDETQIVSIEETQSEGEATQPEEDPAVTEEVPPSPGPDAPAGDEGGDSTQTTTTETTPALPPSADPATAPVDPNLGGTGVAPAPGTTPVDPATGAPAAPGTPGTAPASPEAAAPTEPQLATAGGAQQQTTGSKVRKAAGKDGGASEDPEREPKRSVVPGEAGLPTLADPTISIATPGAAPIGVPNFFIEKFRIPPFLLSLYQAAGVEYGVRWEVLAAINEIETDYGRNLNVSSAGAVGWMQFMPSTWKRYGVDANGDGRKDPYNPVDAIFAAARYLRAAGAEEDLSKAIFAYNHADWYVDSVLMRARLIGGLPSNLVGSLTGLTQGMFPVAARARYADDIDARAASRRVLKSQTGHAGMPVESSAGRRGISIYAKPGSPVVAVQDGKVTAIGIHPRLGRFVQLQDAYGNTYTYGHLGSISKRHPVPKDRRAPTTVVELPPKDPAPTEAASAGTQSKRASTSSSTPTRKSAPRKERTFANPKRKRAWRSGGRSQVLQTASGADLDVLNLPASDIEMRQLRVGSKVVGGTVLGRIGRTSWQIAPHLLFEIRPAGRGAPRIDPKPILDGWKLLESTALYRMAGKNPFFGSDAKAPTIGQILLMPKGDLEQRVLHNPRIEVYGGGRRDIRGSRIDRRVLATLEFLAASGLRPTVTSLERGHSLFTASGNVSHHASGNAVDIARINGVPILGHQGKGSITDLAVRRLLTLQGTMQPSQIITLMKYEGEANTFAMGDHDDHIHVGWTPMYGTNSKLGRQLNTVLKPGQWIKLVDRLGQIDNPTVRSRPSKASLVVKPGRPSRRHRGE